MKPVCLVTGAGGRLGQSLCVDLAQDYEVVATYRKTVPEVPSQLQWPVGPGAAAALPRSDIYCIQADLECRADIRRVVEVAQARHGRIDCVVNSAADIRFHGPLVEMWQSGDEAISQLSVNAVAPFQLVSAVFQSCWKDWSDENAQWNRSVVNVSSVSGLYVTRDVGQAYYAASKAALNILTMYLSLEMAPYSVRANTVCPSRFDDEPTTRRVVEAIRALLAGKETGSLVSKVP
jgi:NAD(P)-dependent dehydrogenase (short-subunit alcohol dehydrogenase family)